MALLSIAALGLRLALIPSRELAENDGPYYLALAAQILRGDAAGALNDYWSQLYPVAIALMGIFTRDVEVAARLVSALCGAALVPATWYLARELADSRTAYVAALAVLFQPWLLVFSTLPLTEMTFTLLIVIGLTMILRAARLGGYGRFSAAGAITALAILTRPEGLLLIPCLLAAGAWYARRADFWPAARQLALAFSALAVVLAPQTIGTYRIYHHVNWIWKSDVARSVGGVFHDPGELERTIHGLDEHGGWAVTSRVAAGNSGWPAVAQSAFLHMRDNARAIQRDELWRVWLPFPWPDDRPGAGARFLAGMLLALYALGATRRSGLAVTLFAAAYGLGLSTAIVHARLLVPLTPFVLTTAALGSTFMLGAAQRAALRLMGLSTKDTKVFSLESLVFNAWLRAALPIAAALALFFAATRSFVWADSPLRPFGMEPVAQKEAGLWLRANMPQADRLISHNPQTPLYFYEGWPFERGLPLPWAEPEAVLAYAQTQAVEYIVLEEWIVRAGHYPVETWLEAAPPELSLLRTFGTAPYRVLIYEYRQ